VREEEIAEGVDVDLGMVVEITYVRYALVLVVMLVVMLKGMLMEIMGMLMGMLIVIRRVMERHVRDFVVVMGWRRFVAL